MILNKMFLSLSAKLCSVTIIFVSLLKCMNCDCGRPGIPSLGSINTEIKSRFPEYFNIEYKCESGKELIYNANRICRKGKWTGRVPKCGKYRVQFII